MRRADGGDQFQHRVQPGVNPAGAHRPLADAGHRAGAGHAGVDAGAGAAPVAGQRVAAVGCLGVGVPMAPLNDWPWRHWARTQPQVTALMLGEQPLSWLALQSQVDELAADFQHQGVEPGCGVALCGKTAIHCCWPIWRCCSAAHVCCRSIPPCRRRCWRSCCRN